MYSITFRSFSVGYFRRDEQHAPLSRMTNYEESRVSRPASDYECEINGRLRGRSLAYFYTYKSQKKGDRVLVGSLRYGGTCHRLIHTMLDKGLYS